MSTLLYSCYKDKNNQVLFSLLKNNELGIDFIHNNGHIKKYRYPEIMGAGIATIDYDLDGDLDLYFVQSEINLSDQLYKSLLKEEGVLRFVNVTEELNLNQTDYGIGAAIGDYNNDGYPDIFLSNWKSNKLLENVNGQFFKDISLNANIPQNNDLSIMSVFSDLNNDGWQDLVSINNINYFEDHEPQCTMFQGSDYCGPASYSYLQNNILQNQSGVFESVPETHSDVNLNLPSLVLTVFDVNEDGLSDFYIGNDEKVNSLWINKGLFQFKEEGLLSGLAVNSMARAEASMGISVGDINSDGMLDFYLTHMWQETNTLYIQNSPGQFADETNQYFNDRPSYNYTGFGTAFIDFENDGDLDIIVANGSIMRNSEGNYNEINSFYENTGNQYNTLTNDSILSSNPNYSSRGLITADLDNDGDEDIIISNNNAAPEIYINESHHKNNWIGYTAFNELGRLQENVESIAEYNDKTIRNIQSRSGSYASSSDPRVLMGLGRHDNVVKVTIRWNKNEFEEYELVPNQYHDLIKGNGISVLSWPKFKSVLKIDGEKNNNQLSIAINQLLASSISKATNEHINALFTDKSNIDTELCFSLQSYELINEASFCYAEYFNQNNNVESDIYYLAAINEVNKFNYNQSHDYFDLAIKQQPDNWLYCFRKTQAYFNSNQYDQARKQLSHCEKFKENSNNDKLSGDIFLAQKQYKNAFQAYREVLKKQPSANNVYYQMGESLKHFQSEELVNMALTKAGKRKLKIKDTISSQLVKYNKDPEFHYEKALLANINQDFESAINAMGRAYELGPSNEKIFRNYALLLNQVNLLNQALRVFIKHEAELSEAESFIAYGKLLTKLNQLDKAQIVYLNGLSRHSKNVALLTNLANNYLRMNELEFSELNYKKILEIEADNLNAKKGLDQIKKIINNQ
ncbi:MAG: FG-GAP-like repeat-containing protein [Marinicellaceae bacterium]